MSDKYRCDVVSHTTHTPSVVFSGSAERLKTNDDPPEVLKSQLQEFTALLTDGDEGGGQTLVFCCLLDHVMLSKAAPGSPPSCLSKCLDL